MADPACCENELGGTPQGSGTECTQPEACCFDDGVCLMRDPLCCLDEDGIPKGTGTVCEPNPCEACCLDDGSCVLLTANDCLALDPPGVPKGAGIGCNPNPCPQPIPTVSQWGLIVMGLLVLAAGTMVIGRRRSGATAA
jgi:hypothetical protein